METSGCNAGDRRLGKNKKRKGDFWAHLLAEMVVRIGFFAITFGAIVFFSAGGGRRRASVAVFTEEALYIAAALGALAALIGPQLYRKAAHRGRGTLSQVKKDSEGRK